MGISNHPSVRAKLPGLEASPFTFGYLTGRLVNEAENGNPDPALSLFMRGYLAGIKEAAADLEAKKVEQ